MEQWMWAIWLGIFVVAIVVEAVGTDLVSIWFAGGAIVALIVSLINGVAWWIEVIVFLVISIALLAALRPTVKKLLKRNITPSNADSLIGQKGTLIDDIGPKNRGIVEINDIKWTAVSANEEETIPIGTRVEIVAIQGNKLIVRPVEETIKEEK